MEYAASLTMKSFILEVEDDTTPKLGMVFANVEDTFNF